MKNKYDEVPESGNWNFDYAVLAVANVTVKFEVAVHAE
jgi:hypothetical protein